MQARLANTLLAGIELEAAYAIRLNGEIVVQPAAALRAIARRHFARGNAATTLSFSVSRVHDSVREAQRFALMHYAGLPKSGQLRLTLGEPGDVEDLVMESTVLSSVEVVPQGRGTVSTYNLVGGLPEDGGPAPDPEPYDDVIRRGQVSISDGARTVTVAFGTTLPSAPFVVACVLMPTDGGSRIFATIVADTINNAGFTAILSGPVPNGNYKLSYIAIV